MLLFYAVNAVFLWGIFSISSLDVVITSLDYIVVLIRRYVFGGLGLVFMLSLLVTIVVKGKSVENDYLEQLATELELSVCEKQIEFHQFIGTSDRSS